jgi:hypothetical protein
MTYIILVLSFPLLVQAGNFAGGTGRPNDPYRIATAEQLISIGSTPTLTENHFLLLNDIDLDPNLPGRRVFDGAVIASGDSPWPYPFRGSFNGGLRTIRNLVIRGKSQTYSILTSAGLFGHIDQGAVVRDLRIEAADVQVVDRRAGILAGENAGRVVNCQVSGRVSSNFARFLMDEVGGLVGRNTGDIINCRADTDWVWGYEYVGGLVGCNFSEGTIVGCRAACDQVCAYVRGAGGLVGINSGCVVGSCATGKILGRDFSFWYGGLVGINSGTILNCHAASDISTGTRYSQVGGLAGDNVGAVINCYANGSISTLSQCYAIGGLAGCNASHGCVVNSYAVVMISIGTNNKSVGGLVGDNTGGKVKMSFWDVEASGVGVSAAGQGLTTAQMQQASTFLEAGWDFVDERANGVTDAWRMPEGGGYPVLTLGFDGYYPPRLAGEGTAEMPYRIGTPEDLGLMWRQDPSAWYQLISNIDLAGIRWAGAPIVAFSGTFDGGGFVISHLTLHARGTAGLFGTLGWDAIVADLGVADANIVGGEGTRYLGVLAGRNSGGTIVRCYATGRLTAGRRSFALGGLIGSNGGSVWDCYARTDLSCGEKSSRVGGLLGSNGGTIRRSYAAGGLVVPDPNGTCGGLLGAPTQNVFVGMISLCYFLAPTGTEGLTNSLGIALTDTRMKQQASFANWDFKKTWKICEGKDYPRLWWETIERDRP